MKSPQQPVLRWRIALLVLVAFISLDGVAIIATAQAQQAEILDIWVDHNVFEDGREGMRIHVKFTVDDLQNSEGLCIAYFYFADGRKLSDSNGQYKTTDGQVSVSRSFTPSYVNTIYRDFKLFMPYSELHFSGIGKWDLKFRVRIYSKATASFLAIADWINFTYTTDTDTSDTDLFDHGSSIYTVAYSPVDASLVASAGGNGTIKLWNLQNGGVTTLRGHSDTVNTMAFSPNGELLASGGDDYRFKLWDVQNQQTIATLEHIIGRNRSAIKAVTFSPDGQLLATAGYDVKLWSVSNQQEIVTFQHNQWVLAVAFSPDGQLLATGDHGGTVRIWDVQNRQVIARLAGDTTYVHSVAFSPDGRTLASAGYQGLIKLWTVENWESLGTFQNPGTAYTVDFSPDGKVLASTGHEVVSLWSVESGEQIASLTGHNGWVRGVAFSPDGRFVASGGDDRVVRVQNIETYLQTLQQRDMVRLIYFLPRDRRAQWGIDTQLDTLIKDTQQFYAEQMQASGFERKTFAFETDVTGKAVVHQVTGKFNDWYYRSDTLDKVMEEINEQFDRSKHLYLIAIDIGSELIDTHWCGRGGFDWSGGGKAIIPASGSCFSLDVTAHELGHALGLEHDFRDDAYIMSYGGGVRHRLSHCAAEWLEASRFFNASEIAYNEPTTIQMLSPLAYPPNATSLRFEVTDTDGLHQAQLIIPTVVGDPADGVKLHSCKSLDGEMNEIEFITTGLRAAAANEVILRVIDVNGNFRQETYSINMDNVVRVDVNGDGRVNVDDLVRVAAFFGQSSVPGAVLNSDINSDGAVDVNDILLIIAALENLASAPAAHSQPFAAYLERWIGEAKQHNPGNKTFQKGIAVLEQLLVAWHPKETVLLPNYPNPFNPETWIPYHLAHDAAVILTIYDTQGTVVRQLDLGYQSAGYYNNRRRAAYWDGRNESGELVASSVYFYQLRAGDYTAVRRMVILK